MPRRRPPRHESWDQAPARLDELFVFSAWPLDALAERYGSPERASRREDWLFATGVLREGRHRRRDWTDEGGLQLVDGRELET